MRAGEGLGRKRRNDRPAARRRQQRRHSRDDLGAAGRPIVQSGKTASRRDSSAQAGRERPARPGVGAPPRDYCPRPPAMRRRNRTRRRSAPFGASSSLIVVTLPAYRSSGGPSCGRCADGSVLEQRQQRLADHPALVAHAVQQQVLAVLIRLLELDVEEDRDQHENEGKQAVLARSDRSRQTKPSLCLR